MGSMVSGLADAVLGAVEGVGLSSDTVARYGKCCEVVVEFCDRRDFDALSVRVVDEFVACQEERTRRGEIGRNRRNALVKSARMMLEFQRTGRVVWRVMSPDPDLSESSCEVLEQFVAEVGLDVAPGSVRLLAGEIRHFLVYLDRIGRGVLGAVTVDDVRGFMVEMAPKRPAGIGNVVWSLKRFFAFLNVVGLSDVHIDGLLALAAPRRVRALPCFTRAETGRLIEGIETETPCGKRDYAMVLLAVSTGLRCCDIVALRLDEIDWRRDEIRLVQAKTSKPLALPLPALAGNAVAEWILHGRPDCDAPEVFVRLKAPFVGLGNSTGSTLMRRRLTRAGIDHVAHGGAAMNTFTSNFAPHIEAMLEWRTSLGHSLRDMRNAMTGFDRFCSSRHPSETVLTRELATAWCRDTATGTWGAYRSRAVREFGKYLQLIGVDGFIVPSAWIARPTRGLPHMFTDDELAAFFRAADSIDAEYRSPFREYTIPVIFRLILGAGLRPPEARRLRRHDVDAENAMVMIERSKRNKDRRVPVTEDLAGLLARFDHLADLRRPDREWFFEDQPGRQYSPAWLIASYHRCCELAGGIAPASTPYTLRHNYATRTLMRWVEEGKDIEAWLPYLAAYMGHQKYSSTAWYVHLLPERLAATGLTRVAGIIPAVTS